MKVLAYIKKLIERRSNESSKRFIALLISFLVVYSTIRYTTRDNIVLILGELLGFILVLMGVAVWESIKKKIRIMLSLSAFILLIISNSCSPIKRHARLVEKYPFVHKTDTVVFKDTIRITVPSIQTDTVIQLDSFLIRLNDTITILKDNLRVQITQIHDSIYINAHCDTVFIDKILIKKVPIKYYEAVKESEWKTKGYWILFIFLILLLLIIILKVMQFLKA